MANSFLPFPQFPAQNLVSPVEVKPATGIPSLIPAARPREPEDRELIKGSILGALSPFLSEAAVSGLASVLPEHWFSKDVATGLRDLDSDQYKQYLNSLPAPERWNIEQAKEKVDNLLPSLPPSKTDTALGRGLKELLTYAPAFTLDEDEGGVEAFIKTAQAGRKFQEDREQALYTASLDREKQRGLKTLENLKGFNRVKFNGSVINEDGKAVRISRQGIVDEDGLNRWVVSQGDPLVDKTNVGDVEKAVPAGQYYLNPRLTASLREGELNAVKSQTMIDTTGNTLFPRLFKEIDYINEKGVRDTKWVTQVGSLQMTKEELDAERNENWIPLQGNMFKLFDPTGAGVIKETAKTWADRHLAEELLMNAMALQNRVNEIATGNEDVFTLGGGFASFYTNIMADISSFASLFGEDGTDGLKPVLRETFTKDLGNNSLNLYGAVQTFLEQQGNKDLSQKQKDSSRESFLRRVDNFRRTAKRSEATETTSWYEDAPSLKAFFTGEDSFLNDKNIQNLEADRALVLATQLQLAYMAAAAAGQTGRTLSDKDLAHFLQVVGYGASRKASTVKELGTTFIFDQIQNLSESNQELTRIAESPQSMRVYLRSKFGVSPELLDRTKTAPTAEEREAAAEEVLTVISTASNGKAMPFFTWDPEKREIVYETLLGRFPGFTQAMPFFGEDGWFAEFGLHLGEAWRYQREQDATETRQDDDKVFPKYLRRNQPDQDTL